jgi:methionyl-tRNA formyltransferase
MSYQPLKIIFMGTPDFAVASLEALIKGPDHVVAVVSQPDKKQGRGKKLAAPAVKKAAVTAGIPVLQPEKIKTRQFLEELSSYKPDLIVVAAYGRILPPSILQLAPLGCINVHGSILPRYRGAAPIQWAVINGDKQAGVSIMQMDEGMDTGDILHIAAIEVDENETAGGLFWKLADLGGIALLDTIKKLKEHEIIPIPQDDSEATHAPMLSKNDGHLNWNQPAKVIHNRIRGLDPWPCAFSFLHGKRLRLFVPEVVHMDNNSAPGTVIRADKTGLLISTSDNCLLIHELQPEGKKRMKAADYLNGHPIEGGTVLE